jgi:hypothetical protein
MKLAFTGTRRHMQGMEGMGGWGEKMGECNQYCRLPRGAYIENKMLLSVREKQLPQLHTHRHLTFVGKVPQVSCRKENIDRDEKLLFFFFFLPGRWYNNI